MNGLSKHVAGYFKQTAQSVAADWDRFWYSPADPSLLCLIRIMTGLMLIYTHAVWGLALGDFFSSTAWLTPSLVRNIQASQFALFLLVSGAGRVDLAGLRRLDGDLRSLHRRPLHPGDVDSRVLDRRLLCQPRAGRPCSGSTRSTSC